LGNGMNLFIYYTSNLWHSLHGMQDRFSSLPSRPRGDCPGLYHLIGNQGTPIWGRRDDGRVNGALEAVRIGLS
jgi:hypothetical protein